MKVRTLAVLVAGALLVVKAPAAEPEKGKTDADRIQGTWVPVSAEREGQKEDPAKFEEVKLIFAAGGKGTVRKGGMEMEFQYTLDPAKKTREIDLKATEDGKEETHKGIYKLDGDTLTLCIAHPPEDRPTDFTTQVGSKRQIIVLKRDKN
jgi:uncharacterized protein (TIGR03067 family)